MSPARWGLALLGVILGSMGMMPPVTPWDHHLMAGGVACLCLLIIWGPAKR